MKAQFVFENIDFERGQDPKKAMGLGPEDMIWNWANEFPEMEGIIEDKEKEEDWVSIVELAISEKRNDFVKWIMNQKNINPNNGTGYLMKRAAIAENFEALEIIENLGGNLDLLYTMTSMNPKEIRKIEKEYKKFKKRN